MHEFINVFPQFQNSRQIRVISHNKKMKDIKKLIKAEKGEEVQLQMAMKALKPVNSISEKNLKKLRQQFKKYFPGSQYQEAKGNPQQVLHFNNIHESIFAKIYLEKLDARTHFAKNQ